MKVVRSIALTISCVLVVTVFYFQLRLVTSISTGVNKETIMKLQSVGINSLKVADGVGIASRLTDVSEEMIIAILVTESGGDKEATSSKGYYSYMQIPYRINDENGNIIIGAWIFKEKLRLTNGNVEKAIILYKGFPLDSSK